MYALLLYLSSILIGVDKGGLPGLGSLALMSVLSLAGPGHLARRTIGIFVPVLAVADISAIYAYRDAVRWDIIRGLVLPMAIGMWFGFMLLGRLPDEDVRLCVGYALIFVTLVGNYVPIVAFFTSRGKAVYRSISTGNLGELSMGDDDDDRADGIHNKAHELPSSCLPPLLSDKQQRGWACSPTVVRSLVGFIAGLLTVIANVAGAIVAVYLMKLQLPKRQMNGTRAWLFFISNFCKIPGQILLGNLKLSDASTVIPLCIAAAVSTYGTELFVFPRIDQKLFERLSWSIVFLGAAKLIYRV